MAVRLSLFIPLLTLCLALSSLAQTKELQLIDPDALAKAAVLDSKAIDTSEPKLKGNFIKNVGHDNKEILLSPFHIKRADLKWLVPLAAATTSLLLTDRYTSSWVSQNGTLAEASHVTGHFGSMYTTAALATGMYFIGRSTDAPRLEETGELSFEALLDTGLVIGVLKHTLGRKKPNDILVGGRFFDGGRSFPSGHSSNAWALATVVAYQYKDRPIIKYGALLAALAISMSRYTGRAHFMSEVLAGSAIGIGTGYFVYQNHH
ncbi:MAG: phosphatase PAP2 family protein [Acidobacteriota bacterium]